jgi:hypothetical protein
MLAISREYVISSVYRINFMAEGEMWIKIVEIVYDKLYNRYFCKCLCTYWNTCWPGIAFGLSVSTVNTHVKNHTAIERSYVQCGPFLKQWTSLKCSLLEELESALAAWFNQAHSSSIAIEIPLSSGRRFCNWLLV